MIRKLGKVGFKRYKRLSNRMHLEGSTKVYNKAGEDTLYKI